MPTARELLELVFDAGTWISWDAAADLPGTPGAPAPARPGTHPGSAAPGGTGPGSTGPGSTAPGGTGPGGTAPGSTGPGSTGPGSTGPGSTGPGSTGPGATAPGGAGPGSAGPGSAGPGSAGPGSAGPGSAGPGSAGPGSAGSDYAGVLATARERSGVDESVLTGEGRIDGRRVVGVACEFAFLGGSVGAVAAGRLVAALDRATREGLPVIASPASGGARMQEGTAAFASLVAVSAAVGRHLAAGLAYMVYLRHPSTGGVLASWGSLGQLTAAEPGALIGYHGPRVSAALAGAAVPDGVQVAENLCAHGLLDAVVPPHGLRALARRAFDVMCRPDGALPAPGEPVGSPPVGGAARAAAPEPAAGALTAWQVVERSRRPNRPGVAALLTAAATSVTQLADPGAGLVLVLARFGAARCVLVGQDRRGPLPGPDGLRRARRGLRLAGELRLPLVSVIDAGGAELSASAEEAGLAAEIARTVAELVVLPVPTLALLLGQGAGGAALAFLPADRLVAAQHGWLSALPPEGAAAILHRDPDRAPELAAAQRITAADLLAGGLVDRIVPEYPDAAQEPIPFLRRVGTALAEELLALSGRDQAALLAARPGRFVR
jgi:acyl-CoA carboxylase subunit beta